MASNLQDSIERHEGWRDKAYQDSEGIWTIGYGRNLQQLRITHDLGARWLQEDIATAAKDARRFPEYADLVDYPARKDVFIEMVFNMGAPRVAGFRNMLRAIREHDWETASEEMLDSKWARQVGIRARRLSEQMRTGAYWNAD